MPTERILPSSQTIDKDEDLVEVQPEEPVKILETQGTFDHMMVWGHENMPAADDVYVKGLEEWIRFAETVRLRYFPRSKIFLLTWFRCMVYLLLMRRLLLRNNAIAQQH